MDILQYATKQPGVVGTILIGTLDYLTAHRDLRNKVSAGCLGGGMILRGGEEKRRGGGHEEGCCRISCSMRQKVSRIGSYGKGRVSGEGK